jgi:hypothetical protein
MPDQANHCPFLNRADERCSQHFSLDRLAYAFRYCFDGYVVCPTYLELLRERRVRRANGDRMAEHGEGASQSSQRLVQLTLASGNAQR